MKEYLSRLKHSFCLIVNLILQIPLSLYHHETEKLGNMKKYLNRFLIYIKTECEQDTFKTIGYSLFPCCFIISIYELCHIVGIFFPILSYGMDRSFFYPLVISVGALIVTILVAIKINAPKIIENKKQFYEKLLDHIGYLNYKHTKSNLYLIFPNINIGTGVGDSFANVIRVNTNIRFIFICKDEKNMSDFINIWYNDDKEILESSVREIREITKDRVEIVPKYDELNLREDDQNGIGVGGYLSDYECTMGLFYKAKDIGGQSDNVIFKGEVISSSEFIHFIRNFIKNK